MNKITIDETKLYDRQIRLWGLEAQQRMRNARILIIGWMGLSNEIAKNLVLAGVNITIFDHEKVTQEDLGCQFSLRESDIGMNRAIAALPRIQALNPSVSVIGLDIDINSCNLEKLDQYDIIVLCRGEKSLITKINNYCHSTFKKFLACGMAGAIGYIFSDLVEYSIKKDQKEVTVKFKVFEECIKWSIPETSKSSLKKLKRICHPVYFQFIILWTFMEKRIKNKTISVKNLTELKKIRDSLMSGVSFEFVTDESLKNLIEGYKLEISPACAMLGGFMAQEILKIIAAKEMPMVNFFCIDAWNSQGQIMDILA